MNKKLLVISTLLISPLFLTACTKTTPEQSVNQPSTTQPTSNQQGNAPDSAMLDDQEEVAVEEVFAALEEASENLTDRMETTIRKNVDAMFRDGRGEGYFFRTTQDDPKIEETVQAVEDTMKDLKFSRKASRPKNSESEVLQYVSYEKGDLECVLEVRRVGKATGNADFNFGCY